MQVADLYAKLGLDVNESEWTKAENLMKVLQGRMKKLAIDSALASMDVSKAMSTIGLPIKKAAEDTKKSGGDFVGTLKRMAVAVAGFLAINKFKGMILHVAEGADRLDKLAQQTGLNVVTIQELGHAASMNGSSMESMVSSMHKLSAGLDNSFKSGKGGAADAMRKLGISLNTVKADLKKGGLDVVLGKVADKFAAMPDGQKKSAIAMDLFGKSGKELIPTLNLGSKGLEKFRKEAHDLGVVMSEGEVKDLAEFGDNVTRFNKALTGLKQQIAIALMPVLKELMEDMVEWVKNNKELLRQRIGEFARGLGKALQFLGRVLGFVMEHWEAFAALLGAVGIFKALKGLMAAFTLIRTIAMGAAIKVAAAWLIALAPFILIGAAIAALIILVIEYKDEIFAAFRSVGRFFKRIAGDIRDWFANAFNWIANKVQFVLDKAKDAYNWIKDNVIDPVGNAVDAVKKAAGGDPAFMSEVKKTETGSRGDVLGQLAGAREVAERQANEAATTLQGKLTKAGMTAATPPQVTQTNNITINGAGGTPEEIAKAARDEQERMLRHAADTLGTP